MSDADTCIDFVDGDSLPASPSDPSGSFRSYVDKLKVLFGSDPDIDISLIDMTRPGGFLHAVLVLRCQSRPKYLALRKILPMSRALPDGDGNAFLAIEVEYSGCVLACLPHPTASDFNEAFSGNPIYRGLATPRPGDTCSYLEFSREPAQYFDDDSCDPDGVRSVLYEDMAREVFSHVPLDGIRFTTEVDSCVRDRSPEGCLDDSALYPGVSSPSDNNKQERQ